MYAGEFSFKIYNILYKRLESQTEARFSVYIIPLWAKMCENLKNLEFHINDSLKTKNLSKPA